MALAEGIILCTHFGNRITGRFGAHSPLPYIQVLILEWLCVLWMLGGSDMEDSHLLSQWWQLLAQWRVNGGRRSPPNYWLPPQMTIVHAAHPRQRARLVNERRLGMPNTETAWTRAAASLIGVEPDWRTNTVWGPRTPHHPLSTQRVTAWSLIWWGASDQTKKRMIKLVGCPHSLAAQTEVIVIFSTSLMHEVSGAQAVSIEEPSRAQLKHCLSLRSAMNDLLVAQANIYSERSAPSCCTPFQRALLILVQLPMMTSWCHSFRIQRSKVVG